MYRAPERTSTDERHVRQLCKEDYTLGWISALPIEHAAASYMLDEKHAPILKQQNDNNVYTLGRIGCHNVVMGCLPAGQIGTTPAATVATQMMGTFPGIRNLVMVGIGGGVPSNTADIRLGDVVVSEPGKRSGGVIQYDFGKTTVNGFEYTACPNAPPQALLGALNAFKAERHAGSKDFYLKRELERFKRAESGSFNFSTNQMREDVLFKADFNHVDSSGFSGCKSCSREEDNIVQRTPRDELEDIIVHYGTIASGNQVIKDATHRDKLNADFGGNILCFEMEAAGLMSHRPALIVRGICDYADSHKNKGWQPYAAATAAICARAIIKLLPESESRPRESTAKELVTYQCPKRPRVWMVPFARNPDFVGRSSQLSRLDSLLFTRDGNYWQRCSRVAIIGLGGVGKTQVGIEFVHRTMDQYPEVSVFWVPAFSVSAVQEAYRNLALKLGIHGLGERSSRTETMDLVRYQFPQSGKSSGESDTGPNVMDLVCAYLSRESSGKWLIVVDNADDFDPWIKDTIGIPKEAPSKALLKYLPTTNNCSILLTTRDKEAAVQFAGKNVIDLQTLVTEDAKALFWRSLTNGEQDGNIDALLIHLSNFPLAIAQATAFMNVNGITPDEYLHLFESMEEEKIKLLSHDFGADGRYSEMENSVATTWLISFERIHDKDELAARFLSFIACIEPNRVPQSLLPTKKSSNVEVTVAVGMLTGYFFLTKLPNSPSTGLSKETFFNMHPLVHLATRNWLKMKAGGLETQTLYALQSLKESFSYVPDDRSNLSILRAFYPHVRCVLDSALASDCEEKAELHFRVGAYLLKGENDYDAARKDLEEALIWQKEVLTESDERTLLTMAWILAVYNSCGKWERAAEFGTRTLSLCKEALGSTHRSVVNVTEFVATAYKQQKRYKDAEDLIQDTLQTLLKERSDAPTRDGLESLSDSLGKAKLEFVLASIHQAQEKSEEAKQLYTQVVEVLMRELAEPSLRAGLTSDLPQANKLCYENRATIMILKSMNGLAQIYADTGNWEQAENQAVQAVSLSKAKLGLKDPDTAMQLRMLGKIYTQQGEYEKAEQLLVDLLEDQKEIVGESNLEFALTASQLGRVHLKRGKVLEGEKLLRQALGIREQHLGSIHRDTLSSKYDLGTCFMRQQRWGDAEHFLKLVVDHTGTSERGNAAPDDSLYLQSLGKLGTIYNEQGRYEEAEDLLNEVIYKGRQKRAYYSIPTSCELWSMFELGCNFNARNLESKAVELLVQVTEAYDTRISRGQVQAPPSLRVSPSSFALRFGSMYELSTIYSMNKQQWGDAERLLIQATEANEAQIDRRDYSGYLLESPAASIRFFTQLHYAYLCLGEIYEKQFRWEDAHRIYLKCSESGQRHASNIMKHWRSKYTDDPGLTLPNFTKSTAYYLAYISNIRGRYEEAEKFCNMYLEAKDEYVLCEAHSIFGPVDSLEVPTGPDLQVMSELGYSYIQQKRWGEAEKVLIEIKETRITKEIFHDILPSGLPIFMVDAMNLLGFSYLQQNRWDEAELHCTRFLEIEERILSSYFCHDCSGDCTYRNRNLKTRSLLAEAYWGQGKLEEAVQQLSECCHFLEESSSIQQEIKQERYKRLDEWRAQLNKATLTRAAVADDENRPMEEPTRCTGIVASTNYELALVPFTYGRSYVVDTTKAFVPVIIDAVYPGTQVASAEDSIEELELDNFGMQMESWQWQGVEYEPVALLEDHDAAEKNARIKKALQTLQDRISRNLIIPKPLRPRLVPSRKHSTSAIPLILTTSTSYPGPEALLLPSKPSSSVPLHTIVDSTTKTTLKRPPIPPPKPASLQKINKHTPRKPIQKQPVQVKANDRIVRISKPSPRSTGLPESTTTRQVRNTAKVQDSLNLLVQPSERKARSKLPPPIPNKKPALSAPSTRPKPQKNRPEIPKKPAKFVLALVLWKQ